MQKEDTGSGHEWTINEINMVSTDMDGIAQMPAVAFSTNLVEGTHLVGSSMKSTLLIGLDKNFFESGDDARDVIFVDNSVDAQIKIHGADKSFLSAGNYVISFVDSGKESSWDTNVLESIKFKEDEEVTAGTSGGVGRPIGEATIMGIVEEPKSDQIFHMPDCFPEKQSTLINADLGCPSFSNDPQVPEESLPLKKKAKMKGPELSNFGRVDKLQPVASTSKAALAIEKKWKKRANGKRRCCYSDSDSSEDEAPSNDLPIASPSEFSSMADIVNKLKEVSLVDEEFANLINAGLLEMKVDIFEELYKSDPTEPSYELLTFAFLLRFKRPPAFHYLSRIFGAKWPTKQQLREWRELVNSKRKTKKKKGKSS